MEEARSWEWGEEEGRMRDKGSRDRENAESASGHSPAWSALYPCVLPGKFNLGDLYERIGFAKEIISRGKFAQLDADNRPFT